MTTVHLATISTALWLVATGAMFILLAHWSTGDSWGFTASIVRGVRGWADRGGLPAPSAAPDLEPLRPILDPYALVRRSAGAGASAVEAASALEARSAAGGGASALDAASALGEGEAQALEVEIIDLGERRIHPR